MITISMAIAIMIAIVINIVFFNDGSVDIYSNSVGHGDVDRDSVDNGDGLCSYSAYLFTHRVLLYNDALWCYPLLLLLGELDICFNKV